jgi:hypothetical protein
LGKNRRPGKRFDCGGIAGKGILQANRIERREGRMIAQEMIRIDVDLLDHAAQPQLNYTPIMSRSAATARFPAVHPFTAVRVLIRNENSPTWFQQILLLGKELIVCDERAAAHARGCEINQAGRGRRW